MSLASDGFELSGVLVVLGGTSSSVIGLSLGRFGRRGVGSSSELDIEFDKMKYKTKGRSGVAGEVVESKGRSAYLS